MKNTIQYIFISLFLISLVLYSTINNAHGNLIVNIFYLLPSFIAIIAGIYTTRIFGIGNTRGNIFLLITLGTSLWFLGDFLFSFYAIVFKTDPFPSYVDCIYFTAYPLLFFGFLKEYRLGKITWTKNKKVITTLLITLLLVFTAYFGIFKAYSIDNTLWENVFAIIYGLADMVLVIIVAFLMLIAYEYKEGKLFRPWLYIFLSMLLTITADILYAIYFNEYEAGIKLAQYLDMLWIGAYFMLAYGLFLIGYTIKEVQTKISEKNSVIN